MHTPARTTAADVHGGGKERKKKCSDCAVSSSSIAITPPSHTDPTAPPETKTHASGPVPDRGPPPPPQGSPGRDRRRRPVVDHVPRPGPGGIVGVVVFVVVVAVVLLHRPPRPPRRPGGPEPSLHRPPSHPPLLRSCHRSRVGWDRTCPVRERRGGGPDPHGGRRGIGSLRG